MPTDVNRDNFERVILEAKEPVLIDFWGPQCKPCLALMPLIDKLENDHAGRLKITKVNATQNRMLCARLRVMSLPTLLLYKDGKEIDRLAGARITETELLKAIDAALT